MNVCITPEHVYVRKSRRVSWSHYAQSYNLTAATCVQEVSHGLCIAYSLSPQWWLRFLRFLATKDFSVSSAVQYSRYGQRLVSFEYAVVRVEMIPWISIKASSCLPKVLATCVHSQPLDGFGLIEAKLPPCLSDSTLQLGNHIEEWILSHDL